MLLGSEDLITGVVQGSRRIIEQAIEQQQQREQRLADVVAAAIRKEIHGG